VVEAYVADPSENGEPPHQLRGFAIVRLKVGETKSVSFTLDPRSFSIYDVPLHRWTCLPGTYEVLVGTSSRDLPLHDRITIR
jgi:beta-glucosidase